MAKAGEGNEVGREAFAREGSQTVDSQKLTSMCVHLVLHRLLSPRPLVVVGLDEEHIEVADDGAELRWDTVSSAVNQV